VELVAALEAAAALEPAAVLEPVEPAVALVLEPAGAAPRDLPTAAT